MNLGDFWQPSSGGRHPLPTSPSENVSMSSGYISRGDEWHGSACGSVHDSDLDDEDCTDEDDEPENLSDQRFSAHNAPPLLNAAPATNKTATATADAQAGMQEGSSSAAHLPDYGCCSSFPHPPPPPPFLHLIQSSQQPRILE
jgi:hypothetical protein